MGRRKVPGSHRWGGAHRRSARRGASAERVSQASQPFRFLQRRRRDRGRSGRGAERGPPEDVHRAVRDNEPVHRLPRDDREGAARHRQRDDADDPQGRGHHVRGGARRSRHLRRKGPVHFPGRGRPDSGCRQRERRGLQLRRGATAPRWVPTAARGDSARRHRRAEVRISATGSPT